jgi:hypothetical protein
VSAAWRTSTDYVPDDAPVTVGAVGFAGYVVEIAVTGERWWPALGAMR